MQTDQISSWLGSLDRDWSRGLSLLVAVSTNKHLIRMLTKRGSTPKTLRLLSYELSRIVNVKSPAGISVAKQSNKPGNPGKPVTSVPKLQKKRFVQQFPGNQVADPYLNSLIKQEKEAFKEFAYLRDIIIYQTISVRLDQAARIVQLEKIKDDLWKQIDYYNTYHMPFPVASRQELTESNKDILNLRSYVSRYKRYAADETRDAESRAKYQRMHDEYLIQLNALEAKIRT